MLGIMFFFTQCEKEAIDTGTNAQYAFDLKDYDQPRSGTQDLWAGAAQNDTDKGTLVGEVIWAVDEDNDKLLVKYIVDQAGWYLTEAHLWVGNEIEDIPNNAAPGLFPFKDPDQDWEFIIPFNELTGLGIDPGKKMYVAAHGVVVNDQAGYVDFDALDLILPETLSFTANSGDPDYYLSLYVSNGGILNGQQYGWCLDPDIILYPDQPYNDVDVFSSYNIPEGHPLLDELDYPENLELVNWIINYIEVGEDYTYTEVQQAIWELLFDEVNVAGFDLDPAPRSAKVSKIKGLAEDNGEDFEPECGQKVAIVLYKSGTQPIIIEYPVPCAGASETAWAFGEHPFNDRKNFVARKWGWIFKID